MTGMEIADEIRRLHSEPGRECNRDVTQQSFGDTVNSVAFIDRVRTQRDGLCTPIFGLPWKPFLREDIILSIHESGSGDKIRAV